MKLKYQWQTTAYARAGQDCFADVADHVRLRVRRRASRSPWFYGMMNGTFCGMWKDRDRAKAAMEKIYDDEQAKKKPAPQDEVRA